MSRWIDPFSAWRKLGLGEDSGLKIQALWFWQWLLPIYMTIGEGETGLLNAEKHLRNWIGVLTVSAPLSPAGPKQNWRLLWLE